MNNIKVIDLNQITLDQLFRTTFLEISLTEKDYDSLPLALFYEFNLALLGIRLKIIQ